MTRLLTFTRTPVVRLLVGRRPSAIVRCVWAVIVDAVQRQVTWARPHVGYERGEVVTPAVAHRNPPRSVRVESVVGLVIATAFGVLPRVVFATVGLAVPEIASQCRVALVASATEGRAVSEVAELDASFNPAFASAHDTTLLPEWCRISDDAPPMETFANGNVETVVCLPRGGVR